MATTLFDDVRTVLAAQSSVAQQLPELPNLAADLGSIALAISGQLPAPVLSGSPGNGSASLSWPAIPGARAYNVYGSSSTPIATVTVNSFTVTSLINGKTYTFFVRALA